MSIIGSAWGQETYSVPAESNITPGEEFQATTSVKLTFGDAEWAVKSISNADDIFKYTLEGSVNALDADGNTIKTGNIKIPVSGTFVKFNVLSNGKIDARYIVRKSTKTVYVTDNDLNVIEEIVSTESGDIRTMFTDCVFDVEAGKSYYMWYSASKLSFAGFIFTPSAGDDTDDPVTTSVSTFNISDFNYDPGQSGIARDGLNRTAGGFNFEFKATNQFVKVNSADRFFFRNGESGTFTISIDENNTATGITEVVLRAVTAAHLGNLTGFSVTDSDGNSLQHVEDVSAGTITISCPNGTPAVNITTESFSCDGGTSGLNINRIDITTNGQSVFSKATPKLSFASAEITTTVGGKVSNALTTIPGNFAVTYTSSNNAVATVDNTGAVDVVGLGTATIIASYDGETSQYYNSAESVSYTLNVNENKTTINVADLNYNNNTSQSNGLDRTLSNFVLTFAGGDGCKYNSPNLVVRNGSGVMTVALTQQNIDAGVTIQKIKFTGTLAAGVGVDAGSIDAETETWTAPDGGVTTVTFSSTTDNALTFSSMDIVTNKDVQNKEKVTPTITFDPSEHTIYYGEDIANTDLGKFNIPTPTTIPENFVVKYKFEGDNTTGASIDESTGVVTLGTPGIVQVVSNFNGKKADDNTKNNDLYKTSTSNVYTLNVVRDYPWTVSDNTLTISTRNGNKRAGGMSTADDSMDDIPGLNVTLTGDIQNRWEILTNAYGKVNPEVKNNIPTSGTYIVLEPTESGTVTIMTLALNGSSYYLVDSNGVQVGDAYSHNSADAAYEFTRELTAENTYYYYIICSSDKKNLGFSSITYTPYPWTIEGNTLTISTAETVKLTTNTSDNLPGLGVTFNATSERYWEVNKNGRAYGKGSPTSFNNNIPQNGTYLEFTPSEDGQVSIDIETFGGTYKLVDENGNVVKSVVKSEIGRFNFESELTANTKYYFYQEYSQNKSLGFYSITYGTGYIAGTAKIWDFRTWSENDIAALGDENNWTSGNDGKYYSNVNTFSAASLGLEATDGLLFTADAKKISPYMPTNSSDGSLRLGGKSVKIALPGLKANQTITISSRTANNSSERGIQFNNDAKLELISGEALSTSNPNIVTYKVKEDVAAGELVMNPSDGLYLYYIQLAEKALSAPSLKWMQGEKDVTGTEISVTAADIANTGITLSNENGVEVTYSSDSDAIVVGADGSISIADGKTVMPGSVITVTASFAGNETYSAYSVSYTMKVEIAYPYTWNFETNTTVSANAESLNNNAYDGCAEAAGLLFTASAGSVEKKDGYLSLDKNGKAVVTIPGLKAGQTVVFKTESAESTDLRGVVCTSGNATLMSGTDANLYGYFSFDVTADGDVTFAESSGNGSVKVYSVTVNAVDVKEHPAVKFVDENGIEITNQSVLWYHVDEGTHKELTLRTTTAAGAGTVKYEIIEGTNATIDSSTGKVTFNALGHVVIKASVEATDSHEAGFAIIHAQHKGEDVVKWTQGDVVIDNTTVTATVGAEFVMPTAMSSHTLPLLYRSSNERAATIDSDGKITLITGGLSTVITAYHASTDEYNGAYASFTLKVESNIKFLSDVNTLKVNIGSKSGVRFSRPNGLSDIKDAVVTVNGAAADSELANKFFSSLKYEAHASEAGPGLLTVAVNDDETLIGEKVQIVIAENYTANNETQHVISAIVEIEITSADSRNFSWVKKSGKMVKGTFIALPAWTGNAGTNSNKLKTFNNIKKEESASKNYRSGEFQPVFTSSDESKAIIGYISDNDIDRRDTLLIYAKGVGTVTIKAADAQNPDLYDEYTLEIVDLEGDYNAVVEKMTFPYTWDFTKDYDLSSLAEDSNYWTDKGDRYSGQMGFFNGNQDTQSCTGLNRAYMKVYGDAELMPIFNGLQLCLGNTTPTSKVGRVNLFKDVNANRPRLNMTGGTHTFKLPAIPAERRPETFRVYVKIRSTASVEFDNDGHRNSWIFAGDTNNPAEEVRRGPAPGETAIYGFDVDPSKDIVIPCANVDIFWIAASTEQTHSTTVNGYPEGDARRTAMATYTYGKALDYSLSKEVNPELKSYVASKISKTGKKLNVTLTETTEALSEGEGVILRSDNAQAFYMIADAENAAVYDAPAKLGNNYLKGTVEETTIYREDQAEAGDDVNYILSLKYTTQDLNGSYVDVKDFGFYKLYSASIVSKAKRSYLCVPRGEEGYGQAGVNPEEGASAEALGIIFEDELGEVTGIIEVEVDNSANANSKAEGYYNLSGVRINKPTQKGVYIHNGKKIVVK